MELEKNIFISNYKVNDELDIERIIDEYTPYVYKIIQNMSYNKFSNQDIEEIISDTFLVIWNNKQKIDENKLFSSYLAGVTNNIIKKRFRVLHVDYNIEDYESILISQEDIDKIIEQREENIIINKTIANMDKEDKVIFIMFYYSSKKTKEIAKELNITETKVKTRLYRIRKKLKQVLIESRCINEL